MTVQAWTRWLRPWLAGGVATLVLATGLALATGASAQPEAAPDEAGASEQAPGSGGEAADEVTAAPASVEGEATSTATGTEAAATADPAGAEEGAAAGAVATASQGEAGASVDPDPEQEPWADGDLPEATLPSFLRTTDNRIKDERPPPTEEQLEALAEMQAEVARFTRTGAAYRDAVMAILQRDYNAQRRAKNEGYGRQILEEEHLQDEATATAIEVFERFIAEYPDDPTYTPDAMFRLGELYFERSAVEFQQAMERSMREADQGIASTGPEPRKSFTPTIDLYRKLIAKFPDYQRIDGVYYLIGYCLNEMALEDEARLAWLNLVCANEYSFADGVQSRGLDPEEEAAARAADEHPALDLDQEQGQVGVRGALPDPYANCEPAVKQSRFQPETWLRIGEYHFDYDTSELGMARAISAYKQVLAYPDDRNYNLALYKLAWAYYRAFRYPEAIENFAALVQWSDDERERTGRAGSELRAEAVQYLAIAFSYDDWNENQVSDPVEGLPDGITRLQDSDLLPQDRQWTPEVYFQLGSIYFDETKYPEAIEVLRLALKRWPMHPKAPEIQNLIARSYTRANQMEDAIVARGQLANYGEGTDWWNANMDHPIEQRNAEELAEGSMIDQAVYHHQQAQRLRRLGVQDMNPDLIRQAQEEYALAASAYRMYIKRYPNNPQAYELQYNLADALFWSENYQEAAVEYAGVRDSNLDDTYLSESARRVVESLKRVLDQAVERGQVSVRTEPPEAQGEPARVRPVAMPQLLQQLAQAREMYLARVDEAHDSENVRESYAYNNTLLLYLYGYWDHASERFQRIYELRCKGPNADETGRVAWLNLRNIAVALEKVEEVERLGQDLQQRQCTFSADKDAKAIDCKLAENREEPQCLAGADLTNIQYKRAVEVFDQAEKASGEKANRLYEKSATLLVEAVNEEPDHPQAPLALEKAAIALERTSRFESAARLYSRIIDEVGPRQAETPEEQKELDSILANAYFRLAFNANRFFDYERAVENYRILADSKRFEKSEDPDMTERREGALINAARILEYQQEYKRAAEYYARAAETLDDPAEKRAAHYRVAEMAFKRRDYNQAVQEMRSFIQRYQNDKEAGELVVQAYWRIAQARKAQNRPRDYKQALADVVSAFARSGQKPGSLAAEYAAEAKFILVDEGVEDFEKFQIQPGNPPTLKAYVDTVKTQIDKGAQEAKVRTESYSAVMTYGRPTWTIAAFVRQGRVYEVLANAVLNTPFVVPRDMKKQMQKLPEYARYDVQMQVEDTIRQLLDQQVRPIECYGVVRYALAARAARVGAIDNEYTRTAIDRLGRYGDERIAECIAEQQKQDATLDAYQSGEFTRAPRGEVLPMPANVSAPPLVTEGR